MRIDPRLASLASVATAPRARDATGERFTLKRDGAGKAGASGAAAPLATLDAILALQAEEDPAQRRRRSARRGQEVLDGLDGLKAALLAGRVTPAELSRVVRSLRAEGPSGDPGLDGVIAEIELRAQVELAKLGVIGAI